jgi:hypothetical protein
MTFERKNARPQKTVAAALKWAKLVHQSIGSFADDAGSVP